MFRTIPPPPQRLLVFARLPELGRVKTRLAQSVGDEKALAIYEAMLQQVLAGVGGATESTEIEVAWAPTPHANGATLRRAFGDLPVAMQTGSDLGERMAMAFSERFFFHRTQKIVAIGVDEPDITREIIDHAFALLDSCEWVIGPAHDGGYYLIGCRAAAFRTEVFQSIDWGSASVFSTTMARIRAWMNSVAVLPRRYDIDDVDDLLRYARERSGSAIAKLI